MEQKPVACGNQLPPLSASFPWLVAQNLQDGMAGDQIFYTIQDQPPCQYHCQIPNLLGRLIRGHAHGWVILSSSNMWSLWNPVTSKIIDLPPLNLSKSEIIGQCCLSAPPDDPSSVLLLTLTGKSTFVFCQLGFKIDRLRWTKMPYTRQLKGITGRYDGFLHCPTPYNGKVYALCNKGDVVIQVDIVVKDGDVSIKLLLFERCPHPRDKHFPILLPLLKGSCTDLFHIMVAFNEVTGKRTLGNVYLSKWVTTSTWWEKMEDIKDITFFVDLADHSVYYNHAIAPELGGYVHIRDETGKMMYSYDVEDKTISLSSMAYPTSHVSLWECRLGGYHEASELTLDYKKEEGKDDKMGLRSITDAEVESNESRLPNLPFHLLEMIMDQCIGIEYIMSFRATCKSCYLAAPLSSMRLHKYSLVSPWLMVVDKSQGIISFIDTVFGNKYFMEKSQVSIDRDKILCSRFGWLLFRGDYSIMLFFNPFTSDICKLPPIYEQDGFHSACFSAPPTSPDCVVVGFACNGKAAAVYVHFVSRERTWRMIRLNFGCATPYRFCFPTFCGRDLYVLCDEGEVYVIKNLFELQGYSFKKVVGARSFDGEYFLVKCDQELLLVVVGKFGEFVKVLKLSDYTNDWEKIECLGRYMICIGATTCLCTKAKVPEMENKIFFSRLHSRNGKIVFYSLETGRYHRFNGKNIEEIVGLGREHVFPHTWIEPTWS